METIQVRGAGAHNLKNADADFPIGEISVVCGPSGCGKSSLVLDVLHAESRRRYLETLGNRAVAVLGGPKFVPVKSIKNLRPSIALECGDKIATPKSNVSTLAEVEPMFRILYAECANPVCPKCGREMKSYLPQSIAEKISELPEGTKAQVLAPVISEVGTKKENAATLKELASVYLSQGFIKAECDGKSVSLDFLSANVENTIPKKFSIVIDRIIVKQNQRSRAVEAVNAALKASGNLVEVEADGKRTFFSTVPRCEIHGTTSENFSVSHFSPWSVKGQCPVCKGSGLSVNSAGEKPDGNEENVCKKCSGLQLKNEILGSVWEGISWADLHSKTLWDLERTLPKFLKKIPQRLKTTLADIPLRISVLCELGLGHLMLGRLGCSLSGGEAQRTRLAAICTGHLDGVLLCLDEPASGLHNKDVEKLWKVLLQLKERGNTLALIEHHPLIISRADWVIEMGPGAGELGGEVVGEGALRGFPPLEGVAGNLPSGIEAQRYVRQIESEGETSPHINKKLEMFDCIKIRNAHIHNLKNINVNVPVGKLTLICGVSGSGKSSLLWGSLAPLASAALGKISADFLSSECGTLENFNGIENILCARTGRAFAQKRSFIATAIGIMQPLKDLFASLPESKVRGYSAATFGTDKQGGRCETCKGDGFLLDPSGYEESECPICFGKRFKDEILEIRFKLLSIADVLDLTVERALKIFENFKNLTSKLSPLASTGLHYLRLGQPTTHLSGGELQRLRLGQDLSKAKFQKTLYLFDEPARGLSIKDTDILLSLLRSLTKKGHTVVAIEHNSAFVNAADCVLELGPGAGEEGGALL